MSAFIVKSDYGTAIRDSVLDSVTETNDDQLDTAEKRAIQLCKDYLAVRFDNDAIFSAEGDNRNEQVVGVVVDIALYYLHRRLNPRKIPSLRKEAFDQALEWLEMVKNGELLPELPIPSNEEDQKELISYGSNPRRTNHI